MSGKPISFFKQATILFHKRFIVLRRNTKPYIAAFLIPIVATALISILLRHYTLPGCSVQDQVHSIDFSTLQSDVKPLIVAGPKDAVISRAVTGSLASAISVQGIEGSNVTGADWISQYVHFVDTLDDFNDYIKNNFANVSPGGFFLGENGAPSTYAYRSDIDAGLFPSVFMQNLLDMFESDIPIATQFTA
jgi:ATP-binding cassette, subfamily A (ABC1), member 3